MIKSGIYDYIDVLDKAADASYLRNEVLANNIANQDTPGYKRKDVDFESVLTRELGKSKYIYLDDKIKEVNLSRLGQVSSKIDREAYGFSYRLDRNNVDPETEQVELAANQLVYKGLIQSMGQEFNRIKSVIK
ncbi:MAG: flagellar basal body rod protein FlgB [Lachnospiraceae bacterium]|nr:flagellar basal body rod protein FlgB [Lachnospiraceae bacterium]MBR5789598.1 flagellar basal body rod protein FlgB [Lachnospiraceae bacterium]